jgi:hypothetical protein
MATSFPRDPRFDIQLIDTADGFTIAESLGLLLTENGGALGFSRQMISPYSGSLAQGDITDKDLGRGTIRSQDDWRGGRGLLQSYAKTDRFYDGVADTRFANSVMLPPEIVQTTIAGTNDPGYPKQGTQVDTAKGGAGVSWTRGARVDSFRTVSAAWSRGSRVDGSQSISLTWAARPLTSRPVTSSWTTRAINPSKNTGQALAGSIGVASGPAANVATPFTPADTFSTNQISVYDGGSFGTSFTVYIMTDNSGSPSNTALANTGVVGGIGGAGGTITCALSATITLTGGTVYWVRIATVSSSLIGYVSGGTMLKSTGGLAGTWSAYSSNDIRYEFNITSATTIDDKQQKTKQAQRFTVGGSGIALATMGLYLSTTTWSAGSTCTVSICADSSGSPGGVLSTGTFSNPGSPGWAGAFMSAFTLVAITSYWIVLEVTSTGSATPTSINWWSDTTAGNPLGTPKYAFDAGVGYGAWTVTSGTACFVVNGALNGTAPHFHIYKKTVTSRAQAFTTAGGVTATTLAAFVNIASLSGSPTLSLSLYNNSGGAPQGSPLATATFANPGPTNAWVSGAVSVVLGASTMYWLVLEPQGWVETDTVSGTWLTDTTAPYAGGAPSLGSATTDTARTWAAQTGYDFYFYINTPTAANLSNYSHDKLQTRRGQVGDVNTAVTGITTIRLRLSMTFMVGAPTLTLKVYTWAGGVPTTLLASVAITPSSITTEGWYSFTVGAFTAPAGTGVNNGVLVSIEPDAPTAADAISLSWHCDTAAVAAFQGRTLVSTAPLGGSFSAWSSSAPDAAVSLYWVMQSYTTSVPTSLGYHTHVLSQHRMWAKFVTVGAITLTNVKLYLKMNSWNGAIAGTVSIMTTPAPGGSVVVSTPITKAAFDSAGAFGSFNYVQFNMSASLAAATTYYIALTVTVPPGFNDIADSGDITWGQDAAAVYDDAYFQGLIDANTSEYGVAQAAAGVTGGASASTRPYYIINNGSTTPTAITVQPLVFAGAWYIASGVNIYKFTNAGSVWNIVNTCAANVTALASFGGKIYALLGDANDMLESSTGAAASWSATAGSRRYTYVRAYNGFMYLAKAAGGASALAYTNATAWTTVQVSTSDIVITGLASFNNELIILASTGMYSLSSNIVYQIIDYSSEAWPDNGKNAIPWAADGKLQVPLRSGLNSYDGVRLTPIGPDMDDGLPVGERGRISAMAALRFWLFAAVDADQAGRSGIYCYNGRGWHCLAKATQVGKRIRALGNETVTSPNGNARVWYFEDSTPFYMEFPSLTDNRRGVTGMRYATTGSITTSRMGGELSQILKDAQQVIITSEAMVPGSQLVRVYLEVDGSGYWNYLGYVQNSPREILTITPPGIQNMTVAGMFNISGNTTVFVSTVAPGLAVGMQLRCGNEIITVKQIVNSTVFYATSMPESGPFAPGSILSPTTPIGYDFRLRLDLVTDDPTKTPVVARVSLKWQETLIDKFRYSATVRIDDKTPLRSGQNEHPQYNSTQLRAQLDRWIKRKSPFILVQPDGTNTKVRIMQASESAWTRNTGDAALSPTFGTQLSLTMDEI